MCMPFWPTNTMVVCGHKMAPKVDFSTFSLIMTLSFDLLTSESNQFIFVPRCNKILQELIRRRDTRTWRDISPICLFIYHWTTTHMYFRSIFSVTRTRYISNGRRFTKSALRMLLLSIFRVSSIHFLPIHTRSSANTEGSRAHCQLKSCKMLHTCSTDYIWKGKQPVNDLHRSFKVTAVAAIW